MKKLFDDPALHNFALLVGRVLLAAIFIISGYNKVVGYTGTLGYMAKFGVPGALLPLVIALELAGGILLVLGWQTRLLAVLFAGFTLLSGLLFHFDWTQAGQQVHFLKNVAIAGGFLALFAAGAGRYSLDGRNA